MGQENSCLFSCVSKRQHETQWCLYPTAWPAHCRQPHEIFHRNPDCRKKPVTWPEAGYLARWCGEAHGEAEGRSSLPVLIAWPAASCQKAAKAKWSQSASEALGAERPREPANRHHWRLAASYYPVKGLECLGCTSQYFLASCHHEFCVDINSQVNNCSYAQIRAALCGGPQGSCSVRTQPWTDCHSPARSAWPKGPTDPLLLQVTLPLALSPCTLLDKSSGFISHQNMCRDSYLLCGWALVVTAGQMHLASCYACTA